MHCTANTDWHRCSRRILILCLIAAVGTTGCVKSYVDPGLPAIEYASLRPASNPSPVLLEVEFQTNGAKSGLATRMVSKKANAILEQSGLFSSIDTKESSSSTAEMQIVINNTGDVGEAMGKGFVTGLTFGLKGSLVTDYYQFEGTYRRPGRPAVVKQYSGAIHSTVGNKEGPPELKPMSTQKAFDTVLSRFMLTFIRALQETGEL